MNMKFKHAIKNGEIEIENVDGQLRITIPGAPDNTCNRLYIERTDYGFLVRSHNEEFSREIPDNE
jgi:hypothetical protein